MRALSFASILCLYSFISSYGSQHSYIYVNWRSSSRNCSCWSGRQEDPCNSLNLALEGVQHLAKQDQHPWLLLEPGNYTLYANSSSSFAGPQIKDFGIVGRAENLTLIECSGKSGMRFSNVEKVTLVNVTFIRCGAVQPTTSVWNTTEYMEFRVGLYFLLCSDLTVSHVNMDSSEGIAVLVYSSGGDNLFEHLDVYNSSVYDQRYLAAGGLYIEFCYCVPGNCTHSNGRGGAVANARYNITHSTFVENFGYHSKQSMEGVSPGFSRRGQHSSLGRGGGMSIVFKGLAFNNTVVVDSCEFTRNEALWGGGLFISYRDNSTGNVVMVTSSSFTSNQVIDYRVLNTTVPGYGGGGGAWVEFVFNRTDSVKNNSLTFTKCEFRNNTAHWGGGTGFVTSRESQVVRVTNSLEFADCKWKSNRAQSGAAVDVSTLLPASEGGVVTVRFTGVTRFLQNNPDGLVPGLLASLGTLISNSVPVLFDGYVEFSANRHTALAAFAAPLYFSHNSSFNFTANRGRMGAALSLHDFAFMQIGRETRFIFKYNSAEMKGGAILSSSEAIHDGIALGNCFVRYYDDSIRPDEWATDFTFDSNEARGDVNAIYTTTSFPCTWSSQTSGEPSNKPFCWSNWTYRWNNSNTSCTDQVETDPLLFNNTLTKDVSLDVYPGIIKQLPLSLAMFDDYGRSTADLLFVTGSSHEQQDVAVDDGSSYISDNAIKISGQPPMTDVMVDLYTTGPRAIYTRLNVTLLDCPTGLTLNATHGYCYCNDNMLFWNIIRCHSYNASSRLSYPKSWVGLSGDKLLAGDTPYTNTENGTEFMILQQNLSKVGEHLCSHFHRTDVLCGQCESGYSPALNSEQYRCVPCKASSVGYKWALYLLTELLAPTVLFLVIMLFNISLTSAATNSFIFFCQVFTPVFTIYRNDFYTEKIGKFYTTVYDMWNLNFFDSFEAFQYCIHPKVNALHLITMEYVVALYPLLLMAVLYCTVSLYNRGFRGVVCLCRPVHHCVARIRGPWNLKTSITHTFAAFLLLSFIKFTVTSYKLLSPSSLYDQSGNVMEVRVYYQGNLTLFKGGHIIYATIAIVILIMFVALPTLLLLLFPFRYFHLFLHKISCGKLSLTGGKVELFLNTFYGGFRNGTQPNSRDWRCFAGLYFVFRIIMPTITFNQLWDNLYLLQHIFCIALCLIFAVVRPYREELYNNVDTVVFGLMAVVSVLSEYNFQLVRNTGGDSTAAFVVEVILITLPLVYLFNRLWVKFVGPARKKFLEHSAVFETSNRFSRREASDGSVQGLGEDDSLIKLIDEHESMVKYSDRSGTHPRRVQFSTPHVAAAEGVGSTGKLSGPAKQSVQRSNSTRSTNSTSSK